VLRISYGIIFHKIERKYNTISVIAYNTNGGRSSWPIWLNVRKKVRPFRRHIHLFNLAFSTNYNLSPMRYSLLAWSNSFCRQLVYCADGHGIGGCGNPPHPPLATPLMLIKSFVTVAVTTSYRNKNWELKLREGNNTDRKFWNQGSGTIQSQQRAKGCLQMRRHCAMKVLS
jgi:hypothetical protein